MIDSNICLRTNVLFKHRQNGQTPADRMAKDDVRLARKRYITAGPRRK